MSEEKQALIESVKRMQAILNAAKKIKAEEDKEAEKTQVGKG